MATSYTVLSTDKALECNEDLLNEDIEITVSPLLILPMGGLPIIKIGSTSFKTTIIPSSGTINGQTELVLWNQYDSGILKTSGTNLYFI